MTTQRYFISFAYDGTSYHGWQIQPNGHSVQAELQSALSTLLRCNITVVAAGRTDTGVHARKMYAHFDCQHLIDSTSQLVYKLNRILPHDMCVYDVYPVAADMHARFSATSRTYHYYIHLCKNPFIRKYSYQLFFTPNFEQMNVAAALLLKQDDFASFCKSNSDVKTTLCKVTQARWVSLDATSWYFEITANRFLRNMVRATVGTLLDVGKGKITVDEFQHILNVGSRQAAGESVPGNALFLEDITY